MFKRGSSVVKRLNVFLEHKFPHLAWINFKQRLKRAKKTWMSELWNHRSFGVRTAWLTCSMGLYFASLLFCDQHVHRFGLHIPIWRHLALATGVCVCDPDQQSWRIWTGLGPVSSVYFPRCRRLKRGRCIESPNDFSWRDAFSNRFFFSNNRFQSWNWFWRSVDMFRLYVQILWFVLDDSALSFRSVFQTRVYLASDLKGTWRPEGLRLPPHGELKWNTFSSLLVFKEEIWQLDLEGMQTCLGRWRRTLRTS